MTEQVRKRFHIRGRVQGVGFRHFTWRTASDLGLVGWVKNLPDGGVLCEAQGADAHVAEFQARLRSGPMFARVAHLEVEELTPAATPERGFEVTG